MFSRFPFCSNNQGQGRHMAFAALGDDIIDLVLLSSQLEQTFDMA